MIDNTSGANFAGRGFYSHNSSFVIRNSIIWGNGSVADLGDDIEYSLVQNQEGNESYSDETNHNLGSDANPLFTDPANGDFTLKAASPRSEEHTSELQSRGHLVCRLLLE